MSIKWLLDNKSTKKLGLLLVFSFSFLLAEAQHIRIECHNTPLNEVLNEWRNNYGLRLSYNEDLISQFQINLSGDYTDPSSALKALLAPFDLAFDQIDETYVIFPQKKMPVAPQASPIQFQVVDQVTGLPLPFCHIEAGSSRIISDESGQFVMKLPPDSIRIRASYLGYFKLDSVVTPGREVMVMMHPSTIGIREVVVRNEKVHIQTMSLLNSGEIQINHQVGQYLPGSADNAVYNLLRLQPGVMAAGEQANDLVVWGSYSGQTGMIYDGITLFGLKNYNDYIGAVNPFMVSNMKLLKGGYSSEYGDKAGGMVEITGLNGHPEEPGLIFSVTNFIVNAKADMPLSDKTSLSLALRETYYNLSKGDEFSYLPRGNSAMANLVDFVVVPDYSFGDFTARLNHEFEDGAQLNLSFLTGRDSLSYEAEATTNGRDLKTVSNEGSTQTGGSLGYQKVFRNGLNARFRFSYSNLDREHFINNRFETPSGMVKIRSSSQLHNHIDLYNTTAHFHLSAGTRHFLSFGFGAEQNQISFHIDSLNDEFMNVKTSTWIPNAYLQDRVMVNKRISLQPGLRVSVPVHLSKAFIQPRLSVNIKLKDGVYAKAAIGKYDQFIVQASILDESNNYRLFWASSDGQDIPVQSSWQYTAGLTWDLDKLYLGGEVFYKRMTGLTRYIPSPILGRDVYQGQAYSMGMDLMAQLKIGKHAAWMSYSLGKTQEHFNYMDANEWQRAPQDQRHEIKVAGMFNLSPWHFSSDYVFGSGFPYRTGGYNQQKVTDLIYSRWDLSGYYRFGFRKWDIQAGLAILNVLNTQNVKLQNIERVSDSMGGSLNIVSEAVPFTPTIFLLIRY